MKRKSKIRYVILIIAAMTGLTCIFTPVVQGKSTKLVFEAEAVQSDFQIQEEWWEDGVFHRRYYTNNTLSGTLNGIEFTGHNELNLHLKIDFSTGIFTVNGKVTWYITLNGLEGTFYGPGYYKGIYMGDFNGKITLQGAGDFNGWKLFGIVKNLPGGSETPTFILSGTVLIPN